MKKIKTILVVLFLIPVMVSCDKDYNCECLLTDKTTGKTSTDNSYPINSTKKSDAAKKCNSSDEVSSSYSVECELK